jgi:hypothetical protein
MSNNKKKPVALVDDSKVVEKVEPVVVEKSFVWVDPSPALHDRLNILLRRRGFTLHELVTPEDLNLSEENFAKEIRLWVGLNGGSELTEEVWAKVLEKLER